MHHCMIKVKAVMNLPPTKLAKRKKQLDRKRIEEFAEELAMEKISEIVDPGNIIESYTKWSGKVMEICEKYSTEKRPKKGRSKCNRLLIRSKQRIIKGVEREGFR